MVMKNKPNSPDYGKYLLVRAEYLKPNVIVRADIPKFLSMLHETQFDYIEGAVEKSQYKDAKEVLKYIMEKP
jgi:hypothetical protein